MSGPDVKNMKLSERQNDILNWMRREGFLAIDMLASHYGVTTQTIRRDINALCDSGLLRRVHGGVRLPSAYENLSFFTRQVLNARAKQAIAERLVRDIPDGSSLFLGIGTTVEYVAKALLKHKGVRVMTNNLNVAAILCANKAVKVDVSGGQLRHDDRDLVGGEAVAFFNGFHVDFGIIGTGGLDPERGLLDFQPAEAQITRAIVRNSRQCCLVADESKWQRQAVVRVAEFREIDAFYTDARPAADICRMLDEQGVALRVAEGT